MEFLITELLKKHNPGSWVQMQKAIAAANAFRIPAGSTPRNAPRVTIGRRKLQKLTQGEDVKVSREDLELLDAWFLRKEGRGLAEMPIFRRQRNLYQTLTEADRVSFLVGSRHINIDYLESDMISSWDTRALNMVKDPLTANTQTETFEIPTRDTGTPVSFDEWISLRNRCTGGIVVSVGSPIASASSEFMLADMFGFSAYEEPPSPSPLRFLYNGNFFRSAFALPPEAAPDVKGSGAALLLNGKRYGSARNTDHGVIVACRTAKDRATFVIGGNGGPGTYAAAEFLASGATPATLPDYQSESLQPVLALVVSTRIVTAVTARQVDNRTVDKVKLVGGPWVYHHDEQSWSRFVQADEDAAAATAASTASMAD
jgi:hypothetical protein